MDGIKFVKVGVGVVLVFLLGVFLKLAKPVLVPFFMALLLSFAVTPLLDFLVRRKVPKAVAVAGILILTFVVLYLAGALFYASGKSLVSELPSYNDMVKSFLAGVDRTFHNEKLNMDLSGWLNGLNVERLGGVILSALGPFLHFLTSLLLVFIFMIFILAGRGRLEGKIVQAFSRNRPARSALSSRRSTAKPSGTWPTRPWSAWPSALLRRSSSCCSICPSPSFSAC